MSYAFATLSSSEFTLNGIPYDKVFLVLPVGSTKVKVVGVYESRIELMKPTLLEDITVNGVVITSQSDLILTLKGILYSFGVTSGGGYAGTRQHSISLTGVDTSQSELVYISAAINAQGPFTASPGEQMVFRTTSVNSLTDTDDPTPSFTVKWYRVKPSVTTIGGSGGYPANTANIMPDGSIIVGSENSDLFIELGDIGAGPVEDAFNLGQPAPNDGDPWIIDGEKFVTATISGEDIIYRFIGGDGSWGPGNLQSVAADFDNLSDQNPAPPNYSETTPIESSATTELDLSNHEGVMYGAKSPSTASLFTIGTRVLFGFARILIDTTGKTEYPLVQGVWEFTIAGSSGSATLSIGTNNYVIPFVTDEDTTVSSFVTAEAANILADTGFIAVADGDILALTGATLDLIAIVTTSGDLVGDLSSETGAFLIDSPDFEVAKLYDMFVEHDGAGYNYFFRKR